MSEQHSDRRRFSRVDFFSQAYLCDSNGRVPCQVCDVSLQGALVAIPAEYADVSLVTPLTLEIPLGDEDDVVIRMTVRVAHEREGVMGLLCDSIDLDSISHLRRLVELNLGDASALEREFPALRHSDE
ncbi:PilZ domain-containing protein [Permianibacter aggregans]|uniref:Cyclic diguanosine monophosphate-binding protein n=1 Tax=Permianibacter aggregans TaxID=1510150 RepID=A0A4R6UQ24_9GAMM|nr:PilZ domain-containing protein [Permianibacter aggregans]QGX40515.1 PilZ domain-containing protein [Permianibacter aggregans]TDQ49338.1 PilZ domain-containing protein [Permianibacter aggregans]